MNSKQTVMLLSAQQLLLEKIALGAPLKDCLQTICEQIEAIIDSPGARSSILLLHKNTLQHGAAPNLPKAYCNAINGVVIGSKVGSCGTAAFTGKQVIVSDIAHDPLWENYKEYALAHGLRACWSTPIMSSRQEILGSFAIYYDCVKEPDEFHFDLIARFTHLSSLAIEKDRLQRNETALKTQLSQSAEKLKAFTSVIPDVALVLSEDGYYVDIYCGDESLLSLSPDELIGQSLSYFNDPVIERLMRDTISQAIESDEVQIVEYILDVKRGRRTFEGRVRRLNHYLLDQPEKTHVLWMARDITERKLAEDQVQKLAFFDPLTSLPNRRFLIDRLKKLVATVERHGRVGALLYLDLDNFKRINDSLGHSLGDQLLSKVTRRLAPMVRLEDTFARIGGDEFVILLECSEFDAKQVAEEVSTVARKVLDALAEEFKLGGSAYLIRCSIGICMLEGIGLSADDALRRADTAMYKAKSEGGNRFVFFDPDMQGLIDLHLQIETNIRKALQNNELQTYFQPQVNQAGEVCGAEALVRWFHPESGLIPPDQFIPVAEQSGTIHDIQAFVLADACRLLETLGERGLVNDAFRVSINISACQFRSDLVSRISDVVDNFRVSPSQLKLELTESMLMQDSEELIDKMHSLTEKGFRFSVDDFGTGYSSMSYLSRFPLGELKIDRYFVHQIGGRGEAIIDAIISMSNNFGFEVVAEGVETDIQARALINKQVDSMQGYFFARPMTATALVELVEAAPNLI